jgi:uncharacterized protein YndB with AHSA1/START domain
METTEKTNVRMEGDREIVVEREFDAPRELVFKAWTDADAIKGWWGPRTYPTTYCTLDLRVGGAWHYMMLGPNGEEAWGKGIYTEITPPERLAYRDYFSNAAGDLNPPEMLMTIEFRDVGGKTLIHSTGRFESAEHRQQVLDMGMLEGMTETLDRLDEYLAA